MTADQERFLRGLMSLCKEHDVKVEIAHGIARILGPSCYLEVYEASGESVRGFDLESLHVFDETDLQVGDVP